MLELVDLSAGSHARWGMVAPVEPSTYPRDLVPFVVGWLGFPHALPKPFGRKACSPHGVRGCGGRRQPDPGVVATVGGQGPGTAHGLMAVSALELISRYPIESAQARIGFISFGFVICKAALEAATGRMLFGFLDFGLLGQPVAVSHAGGIIGGLFALLFDRRVEGGEKKGLSLN